MKRILVFAFALLCFRGFGQQILSQVQAKRGVFTDSLFLKDRWINGISINLNTSDSSNNNLLATGGALGPLISGAFLLNQSTVAQPADLWINGSAVIGSHNSFKNTLAQGWPSLFNVTHGSGQYGLSIQRSSADQGPADIVLYKNAHLAAFGSYLSPLNPGDPIGQISFSGIAGDNNSVNSPIKITGRIEKAAPSFMSSGFVFNTTDSNGSTRQTYLNAQGNLLIGSDPGNVTNNYRLDVASGDVRINSLAGNGDVLVASDSNGVLKKISLGNGLSIYEGALYVMSPEPYDPDHRLQKYTGILRIYNQSTLTADLTENNFGNIVWTRDSVGHYTGTIAGSSPFDPTFTWLQSSPTEQTINIGSTRLYRVNGNTIKLVVKDSNFNYTDDWEAIAIVIRMYITG